MNEIWKPIPGTQHYEVSSIGRVRSFPRPKTPGGILKEANLSKKLNPSYKIVVIKLYEKRKSYLVHRLVAAAFFGESNLHVNHKDGDKSNNKVENLEYVTRSENGIHAFRVLKVKHWRKRSQKDRDLITRLRKEGMLIREICKQVRCSESFACSVFRENKALEKIGSEGNG